MQVLSMWLAMMLLGCENGTQDAPNDPNTRTTERVSADHAMEAIAMNPPNHAKGIDRHGALGRIAAPTPVGLFCWTY